METVATPAFHSGGAARTADVESDNATIATAIIHVNERSDAGRSAGHNMLGFMMNLFGAVGIAAENAKEVGSNPLIDDRRGR